MEVREKLTISKQLFVKTYHQSIVNSTKYPVLKTTFVKTHPVISLIFSFRNFKTIFVKTSQLKEEIVKEPT